MPPSIATLTIVFSSAQLAESAVSIAAAQINPYTGITWGFVLTARISANTSNLTNSGSCNAFLMPTPETRFVFDSTVIQLQPTLAQQHHRKQCNHAKRRVALAVPPFIHPDSLRRRLCTFGRLQKGQGSSKTPRIRAQNLPYLFAILGFLPTIETPNTVEISTVCQPAECFLWSSEGDLPAPVDSCC